MPLFCVYKTKHIFVLILTNFRGDYALNTSIWEFVLSLLNIIFLDLILAGDNAIVIGLAARNLPNSTQKSNCAWNSRCRRITDFRNGSGRMVIKNPLVTAGRRDFTYSNCL